MRTVDRFVDHGAPISFRELCERVLDAKHDYLILDLDKTTHLDRNLGELLAWELCAHEAYGDALAGRSMRRWFGGRVLLDWSQPLELIRYLGAGARRWASAGIHYLLWGKLASRFAWLGRRAYARFGLHPTSVVQRRPQMVALTHLATADEALLVDLARRVWKRHVADQVITRDDLNWVRERSPGIQIILSSASPKAMLDVAVEELGADLATYSTIERINSGTAKIERLREVCPGVFEPHSNTLAISDTSYGEDHCWTEHFTRVVDVNSPTPFPPVVSSASPTEEVHSALLLTRDELRRRKGGDASYLDTRRKDTAPRRMLDLDRAKLRTLLEDRLTQLDELATSSASVSGAPQVAHAMSMLTQGSRALVTGGWRFSDSAGRPVS